MLNENRGLWRGKRLDTSEWVYGGRCAEYILLGVQKEYCGIEPEMLEYPEFDYDEIESSTLGECTGLHDKNGKLIFEGDIIEHKGERFVIKYLEKYMRFSPAKPGTVFAVFDYTQSEIIGNIHDNPELLTAASGNIGNAVQDTLAPAT